MQMTHAFEAWDLAKINRMSFSAGFMDTAGNPWQISDSGFQVPNVPKGVDQLGQLCSAADCDLEAVCKHVKSGQQPVCQVICKNIWYPYLLFQVSIMS